MGVVALWLLVPETRGLPLEEVHLAWADHWLWGRQDAVKARVLPLHVNVQTAASKGITPGVVAMACDGVYAHTMDDGEVNDTGV